MKYFYEGEWRELPGALTPIVDNLDSTDTKSALSANQGKVLNDKIENVELTPGPKGDAGVGIKNVEIMELPSDPGVPGEHTVLIQLTDGSDYMFTVEDGTPGTVGPQGPAGPAGTLDTTSTEAQSTNASEAFSGEIKLHKVSKTGNYEDLNGKPVIPAKITDAEIAAMGYVKFEKADSEADAASKSAQNPNVVYYWTD